MRIQFLDAKSIVSSQVRSMKRELESIQKDFSIKPRLGSILVTGDQAIMARSEKVASLAREIGFEITIETIAERNVERHFEKRLVEMAGDESYMGLHVATPRFDYPPYDTVTNNLPPEKDLVGNHHYILGRYMFGKPCVVPPKVRAVHLMLEEYVDGYLEKGIVVVSTKNDGTRGFFGKYLAGYLYDLGANVTIRNMFASEKVKNQVMEMYNPLGEVVITALNTSNAISAERLQKGSYVIDTGYNFLRTRLSGDVDIKDAMDRLAGITPVPGGIDALLPIGILINAMDIVKTKVGMHRLKGEERTGIRRGRKRSF